MCEPGEPGSVQVDCQGLVVSAEGVYSHIKLSSAEQQGIKQIALADVLLNRGVSSGGFPPGDVVDFVENENALALALRCLSYKNVKVRVS